MSGKADKKIRSVINWLLLAAEPKDVYQKSTGRWFKFKVNFITITLPDTKSQVSEHFFKTKLLNPFLVYCRKYFGLRNYVWKMEFQQNGKLHVHITTDTFIHYKDLQNTWNRILGHNALLLDHIKKFSDCSFDQYRAMMPKHDKRTVEQMRTAWERGTADGWRHPNTTDVHAVLKIKNLAGYLCKYMAKQDEQLKNFKGRIWGCNYELSRALKCTLFVDRDNAAHQLTSLLSKKIRQKPIYRKSLTNGLEYRAGEVFFMEARTWQRDIDGPLRNLFEEKLLAIRNLAHDGTLFKELYVV